MRAFDRLAARGTEGVLMPMRLLGAGLLVGLGVAVARAMTRMRRQRESDTPSRWLVVTVHAEPDVVSKDPRFVDAVAQLGTDVETRVSAAPGGRGSEVAMRHRHAPRGAALMARVGGADPRQRIRRALREVKSLIETGEVVQPDAPPTTGEQTLGGALVRLATRRAGGEGRL